MKPDHEELFCYMWSCSAPPDFPLTLSVTGFSANAPGWRPLVYLGETSCSLYVVHAFILSALYSVKSPQIAAVVPSAIRDLLVFVAVLVAASVCCTILQRRRVGNSFVAPLRVAMRILERDEFRFVHILSLASSVGTVRV